MLDNAGFDKWAGDYDESLTPLIDRFPFYGYYDVLAAVHNLVQPYEGLKVLDVGIGTGLLSQELYRQGCQVYGVDFSTEMLTRAEEKMPDGEFYQVDVAKEHFGPLNNHRFDKIISSYFLHHLNLYQKILFIKKALMQNLCEGGEIIIADIGFKSLVDFDAAREKNSDTWDEDEFYLCSETLLPVLRLAEIDASYRQISHCAGILTCRSKTNKE